MDANARKAVSVIIPGNNPDMLAFCLLSIAPQMEWVKEVIVVEDWSAPYNTRIRDICSRHGATYFALKGPKRCPTDFRLCDARNLGMSTATGEILLFLDEDCLVCPWFMRRLTEIHTINKNLYFTCQRLRLKRGPTELTEATWYDAMMSRCPAGARRGLPVRPRGCMFIPLRGLEWIGGWGYAFSVRRENALKVGKFENWYSYGEEDVYFGYKLQAAGLKLGVWSLNSDIFVTHMHHEGRPMSYMLPVLNRIYLYDKDPAFEKVMNRQHSVMHSRRLDWTTPQLDWLKRNGMVRLPYFFELPRPFPPCLKPFVLPQVKPPTRYIKKPSVVANHVAERAAVNPLKAGRRL